MALDILIRLYGLNWNSFLKKKWGFLKVFQKVYFFFIFPKDFFYSLEIKSRFWINLKWSLLNFPKQNGKKPEKFLSVNKFQMFKSTLSSIANKEIKAFDDFVRVEHLDIAQRTFNLTALSCDSLWEEIWSDDLIFKHFFHNPLHFSLHNVI